MPWQELLIALERARAEDERQEAPDLPHTGEELAAVVQVLLKSNAEEDYDKMSHFIHQALLRQGVAAHSLVLVDAESLHNNPE